MNRFVKSRRRSPLWGVLVSAAVFLAMLWALSRGVEGLSRAFRREEAQAVLQAVTRAAVHCYALEGAYPESLDYLEEHYGLSIDGRRYAVHYNCFASNLMPDIDVVPLEQ